MAAKPSKYSVKLSIENLLASVLANARIESIVGNMDFEIIVTAPSDLTSTQINAVKSKMPFVEVTKI